MLTYNCFVWERTGRTGLRRLSFPDNISTNWCNTPTWRVKNKQVPSLMLVSTRFCVFSRVGGYIATVNTRQS